MDVFKLRRRVVEEYGSFVQSFLTIRDPRVRDLVERELAEGRLWPDPLIQLNPAFEPGEPLEALIAQGVLHTECQKIFAIKDETGVATAPMRLHHHQVESIRAAHAGDNYVLTTGTGSGKSLSCIVPIVDHVLRRGSGRGIQAIVIYPMNALANSQMGELEKFLCRGYPKGRPPVTFRRYTGQESEEERKEIIASPPDILLTNYVILELVLTRPWERNLVQAAKGLRFLVLDELHTYRGRQGADVAMLVRRVRESCQASALLHVGTSATLSSGGTWKDQQQEVARVASSLFGATVKPERVIGEVLRRVTTPRDLADPTFLADLRKRVQDQTPKTQVEFARDPLAVWIESTLGLGEQEGALRRCLPRPLTGPDGAAAELARVTGLSEGRCLEALTGALLRGYERKTGKPYQTRLDPPPADPRVAHPGSRKSTGAAP
jgi:ATP-dependent helicase YprA (DUF1998 family)